MMAVPPERFETVVDPIDGTTWQIDVGFLESNWRCLWGSGCQGIGPRPAPELQQGCCSVGAELLDEDEANRIASLGAALDPARFQFADWALTNGLFTDAQRRATAVVDGACVFLNRPDFSGGPGCALHLAAVDDGDSPIDWKPSICWQLPLKVDEAGTTKRLRRWRRADWHSAGSSAGEHSAGPSAGEHSAGPSASEHNAGSSASGTEQEAIAWCCTEDRTAEADAYAPDGTAAVIDSLADELRAVVGPEVMVELRRRRRPPREPEADASEAPS